MGDALVNYIKKLNKAGYSYSFIKSYLLAHGYDAIIVDQAIKKARKKSIFEFFSQKSNSKLTEYIRQQLALGYDARAIRYFLIRRGYSQEIVDSAIEKASRHELVHKIELSKNTIIAIFLALAVIAGSVFSVISLFSQDQRLLDFSIKIENKEAAKGSKIFFTNNFFNLGLKRSYDVVIEYSIISKKSKKAVDSWAETIGIDNAERNTRSRELNKNIEPGDYQLKAVVRYGKEKAVAYDYFKVIAPEKDNTEKTNKEAAKINKTGINKTQDNKSKERKNSSKISREESNYGYNKSESKDNKSINYSNNISNSTEISNKSQNQAINEKENISNESFGDNKSNKKGYDKAKAATTKDAEDDFGLMAASEKNAKAGNKEKAEELCAKISDPRLRDDCFVAMSKTTGEFSYCKKLASEMKMNICLMWFVQNGYYDVCSSFTDLYLRKNCEALKNIQSFKENSIGNTETQG